MIIISSRPLAQTWKSGCEATAHGNEGFVKGSHETMPSKHKEISLQTLCLQAWRLQAKIWR